MTARRLTAVVFLAAALVLAGCAKDLTVPDPSASPAATSAAPTQSEGVETSAAETSAPQTSTTPSESSATPEASPTPQTVEMAQVENVAVPALSLELKEGQTLHRSMVVIIDTNQVLTITYVDRRASDPGNCVTSTERRGALTYTMVVGKLDQGVACIVEASGPLSQWGEARPPIRQNGDQATFSLRPDELQSFTGANYGIPETEFMGSVVATFPGEVLDQGTGTVIGTSVVWSPVVTTDAVNTTGKIG
ncbi:hypothetical protein [Aestuariimicrobium ganziense]|uniref:hypothetical protein n=1 Tax=Aestuariimicrobium ganziense TaxID=2773677 RepID=UPI001942865C|nr:hypothetical protein [Aestuariimicrobium ganziense]